MRSGEGPGSLSQECSGPYRLVTLGAYSLDGESPLNRPLAV
jgi:hypothetical protein